MCTNNPYSFHHRVYRVHFILVFGCRWLPHPRFASSIQFTIMPHHFNFILLFQGWACWNMVRSLCEAHQRLYVTGSSGYKHKLTDGYSVHHLLHCLHAQFFSQLSSQQTCRVPNTSSAGRESQSRHVGSVRTDGGCIVERLDGIWYWRESQSASIATWPCTLTLYCFLKAIAIRTYVFMTNKLGYPVLSRRHQAFVR